MTKTKKNFLVYFKFFDGSFMNHTTIISISFLFYISRNFFYFDSNLYYLLYIIYLYYLYIYNIYNSIVDRIPS